MKNERADGLLTGIRMVIRLARIAQQVCEQEGLTLPQYRALVKIAHTRHRAHEIAHLTAVSRPAVTALTTGLLRMQLIDSAVDEIDKRGVYFVATRAGKKLLAEVDSKLVERFAQVLGESANTLASFAGTAAIEAALNRQTKREFGPAGSLFPADELKRALSGRYTFRPPAPRKRTSKARVRIPSERG
jgi:DNA-binding MarR family transcriptional regulator